MKQNRLFIHLNVFNIIKYPFIYMKLLIMLGNYEKHFFYTIEELKNELEFITLEIIL